MDDKRYSIGLDIGTSSIGVALVDEDSKLIHSKGKIGYSVNVFKEGQPAAKTRGFRDTRRRLGRKKWRIRLLDNFFEPYILPIDNAFFIRQKESNLVKGDSRKHYPGDLLFSDKSDKEFHRQYPTIYHLRNALMTEDRKFDVREIYWAIHHIVKVRGHFLSSAPVSSFRSGQFNLQEKFQEVNNLFEIVFPGMNLSFNISKAGDIKEILANSSISKSERQKMAAKIILSEDTPKEFQKGNLVIAKQFLNGVLGLNTRFNILVQVDSDDEIWQLSLDASNSEESLDTITNNLSEPEIELIEVIKEIHSSITLAGIVPEGQGLSEAMIAKYDAHKAQLVLFKKVASSLGVTEERKLKKIYGKYINGENSKEFTKDNFYKAVLKEIKGNESYDIESIKHLIELDLFLPKQRSKDNGVIPNQLHQQELDKIISNQTKYYRWLGEKDGSEYKLDKLVNFRVPYYVGPLVDKSAKGETRETRFAWMARYEPNRNEEITPWNFDEIVDKKQSATNFIKRMTTKDTYLFDEDVLPKASLIYQDFEVYNELNNLKINGQRLDSEEKRKIHDNLFAKRRSVTKSNLFDFLVAQLSYVKEGLKIEGLADEHKLMSSLSTYYDYQKIIPKQINNPEFKDDIENIIEWSTIFEDAGIFKVKLEEIDWLDHSQIAKLAKIRYRGWGRLSRRLLTGIIDANGQRIIDILRDTNSNFMMIVSRPEFKQAIYSINKELSTGLSESEMDDSIDKLYTSPQNKKAIRKVLLLVEDIQNAMGGRAPENIFIEFARGEDKQKKRSIPRSTQIRQLYSHISDDILRESVRGELEKANFRVNREKIYLYFLQGGIDLYDGKPINIDNLSAYDVDHIIPQNFIKDDSLNNKALVSHTSNLVKGDDTPKIFKQKMIVMWNQMKDAGLISTAKFRNLTLDLNKIDKYKADGFVNRQLVETRQIIKLVTKSLSNKLADSTKIVVVKSNLTHEMREEFDFPKSRNVNNYHHAFDAYLTALVGNYLLNQYPKLQSYFVYGDFKKTSQDVNLNNFDFLRGLKITPQDSNSTAKRKKQIISEMNRIYNFKKVRVVHEVRQGSGSLFDQRLYKAKVDSSKGDKGTKQLIPKKAGMPTSVYGGYIGSRDAFMSIIRLKEKSKVSYKVIGIPLRIINDIEKNKQIDIKKLTEFLHTKIDTQKVNKKTGEIIKTKVPFEIIVQKLLFGQAVVDGGQQFMLGSSTLPYNNEELYLSKDSIKKIVGKDSKNNFVDVYDEILEAVNKYFPIYDTNKFRSKLKIARDKFVTLPEKDVYSDHKIQVNGQATVIQKILIGLHADAGVSDLKEIGFSSTKLGFLQRPNGIILSDSAYLVYQSPSGLFERKVYLNNL